MIVEGGAKHTLQTGKVDRTLPVSRQKSYEKNTLANRLPSLQSRCDIASRTSNLPYSDIAIAISRQLRSTRRGLKPNL